ncbi:MAG: hypothetical protein C0467_29320 [Planctomycetaceae bacterium]|nr:hypothetical protein [Planctomycetaceae bacterium]
MIRRIAPLCLAMCLMTGSPGSASGQQPPKAGGDPQKHSEFLNKSLGSVNESYRGQHQWFNDDLVLSLFSMYPMIVFGILTVLVGVMVYNDARKEIIYGFFALATVASVGAGIVGHLGRVAELKVFENSISDLQNAPQGTSEWVMRRDICEASSAKVRQSTILIYLSLIVLGYSLLFFTIVAARVATQPVTAVAARPKPVEPGGKGTP